ncbi:HNH endonuclease [Streptomyces sp. NPDC005648]|uniref:HNH endonuclease n=1 Tax=Streptomyces sp. NPDC005648 TaxID=3157044 RepID=UPI0033AF93FE
MSATEEWKQIPGFLEEASSLGRVRLGPSVLRPFGARYATVRVTTDEGHARLMKVHEAVLRAFRGPRPDGLVASHLNCDPDDNRPVNLKWETPAENVRRCVANGCYTNRAARSRENQRKRLEALAA